ncbi:Gfo/Idh/MocA family oxidoreductase [Vallitalea pronyensis]|uniref:Gfo/Idh/MocA family oxidoreductase n=1 Tax=Vallitalea pronyensis TaxID=1348613 RepID=A0A8J8SFE1_9FIRM|nr:Gfo/Idh/MocA family oxidoreductase [Vallitalea pronyensis]QUI21163.1 Gfo/Idh/MocA family oxidoreductase [Vallitalea pronyensis]
MFNEELRLEKPLRWGMIGGGRGSQIGYIHRSAALRDGLFTLVAGAFDIDPERCEDFGTHIGLDKARCYPDYKMMLEEEAKRHDGIQVVSIATPNKFHYEMAKAALEAGLHVICEKPLCFTVAEAETLKTIAEKNKLIIGVTYGYTGYQMIHQARKMIENGDLGDIRIINMSFAHGWHSEEVEKNDPGLKWRVTPEQSGPTYVLGDIGTHALYLAEVMMPELKIEQLMCSRQSFIASRAPLEDNAVVLMNFNNGAVGNLWVSAVNAGAIHEQRIRVVGSKASIEWWDEHPNQLVYEVQGKPKQLLDRGHGYLYHDDMAVTCDRIGCGHAEGLFESWANLYQRYAIAIDAMIGGDKETVENTWFPDIHAGLEGVRFIENCVRSADNGSAWVDYK